MDKNLIKNATQIINQKQNNLFFGTEYVQSIIDKNQNPQYVSGDDFSTDHPAEDPHNGSSPGA